jgi:hypothetical protein
MGFETRRILFNPLNARAALGRPLHDHLGAARSAIDGFPLVLGSKNRGMRKFIEQAKA